MYRDLRRASAERLVEMDFDGYAIGRPQRGRAARTDAGDDRRVLPLLPAGKLRYVMGVGYPDEIEEYARMGVDMMDCVLPPAPRVTACSSPAKAAEHQGRALRRDQSPPTRPASAWSAAATRAPTCATSRSPVKLWPGC